MKRRTRTFWLALGCMAAAASTLAPQARAVDGTGDEVAAVREGEELLATRVRAFLRELSADPWQRRGRAQEALVEMGEMALPFVERFLKGEIDEEARVRAEEVAQRIRRNVEEGPTLVTMELNDVPAGEAFAELSRVARLATPIRFAPRTDAGIMPIVPGVPEMRRRGEGKRVTMKVERRPFWEVFREMSAKAGVELVASQELGALLLREGNNAWPFRPVSYSGPFMLSALRIDERGISRGPQLQRVPGRREFTLCLLGFAEPKLRPVSWSILRVEQCVDEKGQSMIDISRPSMGNSGVNSNVETRVALYAPAEPGKRIERMELVARYTLEVRSEAVEVFDVMESRQSHRLGEMQFRINEFTKLSEFRYSMSFTVTRDGRGDREWNEIARIMQRNVPKVYDEEGRALETFALSTATNPREFTRTCEIRRVGARPGVPSRVVWRLPVETRTMDARFVFEDLLLP